MTPYPDAVGQRGHVMACPWSLYICSGRSGDFRPLRVGIEAPSSDQTWRVRRGFRPEGAGRS